MGLLVLLELEYGFGYPQWISQTNTQIFDEYHAVFQVSYHYLNDPRGDRDLSGRIIVIHGYLLALSDVAMTLMRACTILNRCPPRPLSRLLVIMFVNAIFAGGVYRFGVSTCDVGPRIKDGD